MLIYVFIMDMMCLCIFFIIYYNCVYFFKCVNLCLFVKKKIIIVIFIYIKYFFFLLEKNKERRNMLMRISEYL